MCLQVHEWFAGCQHITIKETKCQEADEVTNWSAVFCPHFELVHHHSGDNCGIGGYYCSKADPGAIMDEIHKLHDHATKLVMWTQHQYDLADKHVETLNRIFDQANVTLAGRMQHKDMISALQDRRAKEVQCARARYRARQLSRKIDAAHHWYKVVVPTALSEGKPTPRLLLPVDELWVSPTLSTAMPVRNLRDTTLNPGNVSSHILPSNHIEINPALQNFTIEEDLGSLGTGAWLEKPSLDNLPVGQFTGDRRSAITMLAHKHKDAMRKQYAQSEAQAARPEPAETAPTRKRKRCTTSSDVRQSMVASEADDASLTVTQGRTRRSVPKVNYSEQLVTTSSDSGEDASTGSVYNDEQSGLDSLPGSTMIGTMSPFPKHDHGASSIQSSAGDSTNQAFHGQPQMGFSGLPFSHAHGVVYGKSPAVTTATDSTAFEQGDRQTKKDLDGTSENDLEELFDDISNGSFFAHVGYGV